MKHHYKITALLATLAGVILAPLSANEAPQQTWELNARLDAGGNEKIASLLRRLIQPVEHALQPGAVTSIHAAGYHSPENLKGDWIMQIQGLSNTQKLIQDAAHYSNRPLVDNRLFFSKNGLTAALWSPREGLIRLASPLEKSGDEQAFSSFEGKPRTGTWLDGKISLTTLHAQLSGSTILHSINNIDFAAHPQHLQLSLSVPKSKINDDSAKKAQLEARRLMAAITLLFPEHDISIEDLSRHIILLEHGDEVKAHLNIPNDILEQGFKFIEQQLKNLE